MLGIPTLLVVFGLIILAICFWRLKVARNVQSKHNYFLTHVGGLKAQIEETQKLQPKAVQIVGKVILEYPISLIQSYRDYCWYPGGIEEFSILLSYDKYKYEDLSPLLVNWPYSLMDDVPAELTKVWNEATPLLSAPIADFFTNDGLQEWWTRWYQLSDRLWKANTAVLLAIKIEYELKKAFDEIKDFLERKLWPELEAVEVILGEKKPYLLPEFYEQVKRYYQQEREKYNWVKAAKFEDKKDWFELQHDLTGSYVHASSIKCFLSARSDQSPVTEKDMPFIEKYGIV